MNEVKSYEQAAAMLKTRKRKLARSTYLVELAGCLAVRLHATPIVKFYPNGDVELNSGTWRTPTTKERMNDFSPIRVWQNASVWYAKDTRFGHRTSPYIVPEDAAIFADGIVFHITGKVSGAGDDDPKKVQKLRRAVREYAAQLVARTLSGEVGAPSHGDCWFCLLREEHSHKTLGDVSSDVTHLLSHIKEKYYVPSLLANAIDAFEKPREHMGATWSPVSPIAKSAIGAAWSGEDVPEFYRGVAQRDCATAVANYIFKRLGQVPTRSVR